MATRKKAAAKKDLATTKNTQLSVGFDISKDVGAGMEGTDKDSFAIPFLAVIQKMSPQVDEADPKFHPDARPGMLFNTVTNELFSGKDGVIFLPCAFQRRFLRWAPRDAGGGFKGEITPEEATALEMEGAVVNESGRLYFLADDGKVNDKTCDYLSDTRNHFGVLVTGQMTQVLMSLSSTQIKKSKQLMTLLNNVKYETPKGMVTPPTWMNQVRITTVPESNDKGSWHGIKVELDGFIDAIGDPVFSQKLYDAGKNLHDIISAGKVSVNYETVAQTKPDDKF